MQKHTLHLSSFVCMCAWGSPKLMLGISLITLPGGVSQTKSLPINSSQLVLVITSPSSEAGITSSPRCTSHIYSFWGSELQSSSWCSKVFNHWTTSLASINPESPSVLTMRSPVFSISVSQPMLSSQWVRYLPTYTYVFKKVSSQSLRATGNHEPFFL